MSHNGDLIMAIFIPNDFMRYLLMQASNLDFENSSHLKVGFILIKSSVQSCLLVSQSVGRSVSKKNYIFKI